MLFRATRFHILNGKRFKNVFPHTRWSQKTNPLRAAMLVLVLGFCLRCLLTNARMLGGRQFVLTTWAGTFALSLSFLDRFWCVLGVVLEDCCCRDRASLHRHPALGLVAVKKTFLASDPTELTLKLEYCSYY